jgi:dynactin complex subunit
MDDIERVNDMMRRFTELFQAERALRQELQTFAADIKYQEKENQKIDEKVTDGIVFAGSLREANRVLDELKRRRDATSDKLEIAVKAKENYRAEIMPVIKRVLISKYKDLQKAENVLRERAVVIQKIGTAISTSPGFALDVFHGSPICSGASITVTNRDQEFFESLIEGEKTDE